MKRALLIVEDELMHQENLLFLLKKTFGDTYELLVAGTGAEALQLMSIHYKKIDLIFLDINLPDKNGPEVYREMATRVEKMPKVIMVTAFDQSDDVISAMLDMGASDYVVKPFRLKEFRQKIIDTLDDKPRSSGNAKDKFIQKLLEDRNKYYLDYQVDNIKSGMTFESVDDLIATYKSQKPKNNKSLSEILTMFEEDTGIPLRETEKSRVLYVEDDETLVALTKRLLSDYKGYDVVYCKSLKAAQDAIKEHSFDIYITDLGLEDGGGETLIQELHRQWDADQIDELHKPEIIVVSGDQSESTIVDMAKRGINNYLVKPVPKEDFLKTLNEAHLIKHAIRWLPEYLNRLQSRSTPFRYKVAALYQTMSETIDFREYKEFLPELNLIPDSDYNQIDTSTEKRFIRSLIDFQKEERHQM